MGIWRNLLAQARKEPLAVVGLIVAIAGGVLNSTLFWQIFERELEVRVGVLRDQIGRCVDREIRFENKKSAPVRNIRARLGADYLTRRGDILLDLDVPERMMIGPGERTVLPRAPGGQSVAFTFDAARQLLIIPELAPGEAIHMVLAESGPGLGVRPEAMRGRENEFANRPAFEAVSHNDGLVHITYVLEGGCLRPARD